MPRGSKPGERRGGRQKGTPNKSTQDIQARLASLGCDPIEGMAKIAIGDVTCPECRGKKRQAYATSMNGPYVDPDMGQERTCLKCHGTGLEPIPVKLAADMFAELAQYVAPKRKAIEHSGAVETTPVLQIVVEG